MIARQYSGAPDLRLMQQALIRGYASTETRIGDLAWRARYHTHYELSLEIRLWFDASDLLAWTWLRTRGGFDTYVVPERRSDEELWTDMIDSIEATVSARLMAGDDLEQIYTWFTDDDLQMAARLRARGFIPSDEPGGDLLLADLGNLPEAVSPPGYELGWVSGEADINGRVESHRAAFAPSDLTVPMYRRVRRTWPYRAQLDRIVKTSGGDVAACCTAWLDETNGAGLLEPVSTHPAHQNRGLARLVVGDALRALCDAGATVAMVGTSGPAARAAYTAAGFRPWKREVTMRKPVGGPQVTTCESG